MRGYMTNVLLLHWDGVNKSTKSLMYRFIQETS